MTCGACARAITRRLSRVEGVTSAEVSLEGAKATVVYDEKRASAAKLIAAVQQIGYTAGEA
jgi:copper chaperone CopZ